MHTRSAVIELGDALELLAASVAKQDPDFEAKWRDLLGEEPETRRYRLQTALRQLAGLPPRGRAHPS